VAENLWALREQKKISVAGLANRAGLPIGLIMEYESGARSIDPRHLSRLARALYVEESEIRLQSDARPGAPPLERQGRREAVAAPAMVAETSPVSGAPRPAGGPPARGRPMRGRSDQRPPAPPRPSQLAHLNDLLARLNRTPAELEMTLGKPVSSLDRVMVSQLLKTLQEEARKITVERHRAYLPEGVDQYENRYLNGVLASGEPLQFTLFDGQVLEGAVTGFGPYNITIRQANGDELTLNKLAVVSYARQAGESRR
jgi:transcriptional regulator with XRE-family HTH domain